MSRQFPPKRLTKKISTMPRKETPANIALENYKLTIEEARLQQELRNIEIKRQQILSRLEQLSIEIENVQEKIMKKAINSHTQIAINASQKIVKPQPLKDDLKPEKSPNLFQFKTMDIDY